MSKSNNPLNDPRNRSAETQLVHGGTMRSAFNETSVALYLTSGIVGGLLILAREHWARTDMDLVVGASGCIMGLVGASTAVLLRGFRREKALVAKRRLYLFVAVIVLQTIVDFQIPQVSFFAHIVGAITGFLTALAVTHPGTEREPPHATVLAR